MSPRVDWRTGPASVYRLQAADGTLLYIGVSGSALQRFQTHASTKGWWLEVATVQIEHFERRFDALLAEERAILTENPKYNGPFSEEKERRRLQRIEENRPEAILARQQEQERLREARRHLTMYRVRDLRCSGCGWTGNWIKKGCRIEESACPTCGLAALTGTPEPRQTERRRAA